jgi:phage host-nuclease inhibitor protein Gam
MQDTPIADPSSPAYGADMEARVSRLETDMGDVRSMLGQMMPMLIRVESMLTATLPHLATKAEVSDLRAEMHREMGMLRTDVHDEIGALRSEVHDEIGTLRTELHNEIGTLRTEVHDEIGTLRTEVHNEIGTLRTEVHDEIGTLRTEVHDEIGTLRGEVHQEIGAFRAEVNNKFDTAQQESERLRADLADKPGKVYLWGVLTAMVASYAAGLAVLAVLK